MVCIQDKKHYNNTMRSLGGETTHTLRPGSCPRGNVISLLIYNSLLLLDDFSECDIHCLSFHDKIRHVYVKDHHMSIAHLWLVPM